MKHYIKKIKIISLIALFIACANSAGAQGINDIGLVWEKRYGTGYIYNIQPNKNKDGYVACGEGTKKEGLVIEFDESGKEIRRVTTHINTIYSSAGPEANGRFAVAFKTDDGGILAFGHILNPSAPANELMPQWAPGLLIKGIWIVKYDKNLNIVSNERVIGSLVADGAQTSDGMFVIGGMDRNDVESQNGTSHQITLLRKYDQNGKLKTDSRANYREISSLYRFPGTDNFIASTPDRILKINSSPSTLAVASFTYVPNLALPSMITPYMVYISPTLDGGAYINSHLNSNQDRATNYANGNGIYRLKSDNTHWYNKISQPSSSQFTAPLLLPGNNNPAKYIGTLIKKSSYDQVAANCIYELTDNGAFTYREGSEYVSGTQLRAVSVSDGFFSTGQNPITKEAVIAKYSTCAKFVINNVPADNRIIKDYAPSVSISMPFNYQGSAAASQGDVTYDLLAAVETGKVNNTTSSDNGGQLENLTNQQVSTYAAGSGKALDLNRTYTLAEGPVVIKYILTIKEKYTLNGTAQSCSQTYVFRLIIAPKMDVVAMPTLERNGSGGAKIKASIKNIGQAIFNNPFKITVYKNTVGDATKYVYTYANTISQNETTDFEINIPNFDTLFAGASKVVVSFNDGGDTIQNQVEIDAKECVYEVNF